MITILIMRVLSDIISNDEMLSDSYKLVYSYEDTIVEVKTQYIVKKSDDDCGISENKDENEESKEPSATSAPKDAKVEDTSEKVLDVLEGFKLKEMPFSDKKQYTSYMKVFFAKVVENLKVSNPKRVEVFKKQAVEFLKYVLKDFDNFKFYVGESYNPDGGLAASYYKPGDETPTLYYYADGLKSQEY